MSLSFGAGVRDSLSNLAASLGAGRDKAGGDAFTLRPLGRAELEAMYRGDWLARKVVDIVPDDSARAWRSWSGHRADVARVEAAERRLGLRRTVQWRHLESLRHSRRRSIEIEQDGARLIMFDNASGHHLCFIDAELDAAGQLLRVIADLERDPFA